MVEEVRSLGWARCRGLVLGAALAIGGAACTQKLDVGASIDCRQWPESSWVDEGAADAFFPQGFVTSEVASDSALVWVRTSGAAHVRVHYRAGPLARDTISQTVETTEASAFTGVIRLSGLRPATCYRYELVADEIDGRTRSGQFVSAPSTDVARSIAFSADISADPIYDAMIEELYRSGADLFLSLGDFPYVDPIPGPLPETTDDYLMKYIESRSRSVIRELHRRLPIRAIWDDHEIQDDWDGAIRRDRPDAVASGQAIWHQWFPVEGALPGEIYRSFFWGPNIHVFELDARSHRDPNRALDTPSKTMLGTEQREWLLSGLAGSPAAFKLVISSVPFWFGTTGSDSWDGFSHERAMIVKAIVDRKIGGVVFLTADQHWFSVHHSNEGIKELQVGPLAQILRSPPINEPRAVVAEEATFNFGLLRYEPTPSPRLLFEGITEGGRVIYSETILAGRGSIRVSSEPSRGWLLTGAHTFSGRGAKDIPWATPGTYTVHWDADESGMTLPEQTLQLEDEREIVFSEYDSAL